MSHEWTCRCPSCADDWRDWITLEDHAHRTSASPPNRRTCPMPRVQTRLPLGNGLTLAIDRDDDSDFYVVVGRYVVETLHGDLIVRLYQAPDVLLKVPLDAA